MRVTPSMLKEHRTRDDAWSAFNGKVYNITSYLPYHPGGEKELMRVAGRDGSKLFGKLNLFQQGCSYPYAHRDSSHARMGESGLHVGCLSRWFLGTRTVVHMEDKVIGRSHIYDFSRIMLSSHCYWPLPPLPCSLFTTRAL